MISTDTNASLDAVARAAYEAFSADRQTQGIVPPAWDELPDTYKTSWRVACHAAVGTYLVRL